MPDSANSVEAVFINLDRDAERRAAMEAQLSEIQLPYPVARFAGIDGSLRPGCPANLRPGQYGCWLSHMAALERSVPNGRHLHVMEDDVLLSQKFAAVLSALGALSGSGENWDILYLDAILLEIPDMHQVFEWVKQSRQSGVVQVCKIPAQFTVYGTPSYIVNSSRKKHLRDFLNSRLDEGRPIDNVIASGIQKGQLKAYLTAPFLTSGGDGSVVSTIGYEAGDEAFLPSLLFRRLCFYDLGEGAAAALAARVAELTRDVARPDAIFGALCGYRVEKWPNTYFPPDRLALGEEAPPATADGEVEISAVMPCLNEARTIGICVEKAKQAFARLGMAGEVVVADNGSTDGSAEIARASGARVVSQPVKGYGAALQAGIEAAQGRLIVMADADDSYDWSAIEPLVLKLREGYDLVVGNRFRGGILPGAMPWLHRYVGNPVLSGFTRLAFGVAVGDVHCGMRAFTKTAFERMRTATLGMEFATEMIANAAHNGLRITEVPTRLYPDKRGRPPHLRSFRDGWRHLRFILTYAPDYLYLAPGAVLLAAGLLLQALLVAGPVELGGTSLGIHYLALGAMLSLVGFNVINLGVLAKAVMGQRYDNLKSRTIKLITRSFSLEGGLITGVLLMLAGLSVDGAILAIRLAHPGEAMEGTVHLAFVATTMVVLGLNLVFSSFLLAMVMAARRGGG